MKITQICFRIPKIGKIIIVKNNNNYYYCSPYDYEKTHEILYFK